MNLPIAPPNMYKFRNSTITNFSYDNDNNVEYSFNSLGYRGPEFIEKNPIIILGNTLSFGLGIDYNSTYGSIINKNLNYPVYNFSFGGVIHTNFDQLDLFKKIIKTIKPKKIIWQINNLNRIKDSEGDLKIVNDNELIIQQFKEFFVNVLKETENIPIKFLHWDPHEYNIDYSKFLIHNKYHVDCSLTDNKNSFGAKTHKLIALKILQNF